MFHWVDEDDETPTGCLALCQTCRHVVVLTEIESRDDNGVPMTYRVWQHYSRWPGGYHDPEPMPSPADKAEAAARLEETR